MPRPQVVVNVTSALPRRGSASSTGLAVFAYTAATGPTTAQSFTSQSAAATALGDVPIVRYVGDALAEGAPEVVVVRAIPDGTANPGADPALITQAQWTAALDLAGTVLGAGQVAIPGVSTTAAHAALVAHADVSGRTALLDGAIDASATDLTAAATAHAASPAAQRVAVFGPWLSIPVSGGTTREVPPSVIAAGLIARGDAQNGHANHAPAGDQGLGPNGPGVSRRASAVLDEFTDDEWDTLADAGVNLFISRPIGTMLYGFRSVSNDARFLQLNHGRMTMQLSRGLAEVAESFLFRQLDGRGQIHAEFEGTLRGFLLPLENANALYGENGSSFDVVAVRNPENDAAGLLEAAVEVSLTSHTETVQINVVTTLAQGVAA